MKVVVSRNNEPWTLSAAAAAAAVLFIGLAQTSTAAAAAAAIGINNKQEGQLPAAARSDGEETAPRSLGRSGERQLYDQEQEEATTCNTINLQVEGGPNFDSDANGEYVDIGWTSGDRPVFFSYQNSRNFVLIYAETSDSSSSSSSSSSNSYAAKLLFGGHDDDDDDYHLDDDYHHVDDDYHHDDDDYHLLDHDMHDDVLYHHRGGEAFTDNDFELTTTMYDDDFFTDFCADYYQKHDDNDRKKRALHDGGDKDKASGGGGSEHNAMRHRRGLGRQKPGVKAHLGGTGRKNKPSRGHAPWHNKNKAGIQKSVAKALSLANKRRREIDQAADGDDSVTLIGSLLACEHGAWIVFPLALEKEAIIWPIYIVLDCSEHPTNITTPWITIDDKLLDHIPEMDELSPGMDELEEVEEIASSSEELKLILPFLGILELSFTCADDAEMEKNMEMEMEYAGYSGECVDLGASGCESREDCCGANYLTVEEWCRNGVCGHETASLSCWDERCCNKTGRVCEKDRHCCDGLSCISGFCAKPSIGCLEPGLSGCATSTDCCSDYYADTLASCKKGRCCYKDDGACQSDTQCCKGYKCDDSTSKCKRSYH